MGDRTASTRPPSTDPRDAFAQLATVILADETLESVLQRVADLAVRTVAGAEHGSVTLVEHDQARTAAFTSQCALDLDERQYDAGFGPCLDAADSGATFGIEDTSDGRSPWPDFARHAAQRGVRSTLSVGLPLAQRVIGGLNIYGSLPRAFDEESVSVAREFAGYAAVALANASLYASTAELARHLETAMRSRAVIDQAKGILIARHHCTPERAFAMLREASQRSNRKLRTIAETLVASESGERAPVHEPAPDV